MGQLRVIPIPGTRSRHSNGVWLGHGQDPGVLVARIVVTGPSIRAGYELYVGIGKAAQLTD